MGIERGKEDSDRDVGGRGRSGAECWEMLREEWGLVGGWVGGWGAGGGGCEPGRSGHRDAPQWQSGGRRASRCGAARGRSADTERMRSGVSAVRTRAVGAIGQRSGRVVWVPSSASAVLRRTRADEGGSCALRGGVRIAATSVAVRRAAEHTSGRIERQRVRRNFSQHSQGLSFLRVSFEGKANGHRNRSAHPSRSRLSPQHCAVGSADAHLVRFSEQSVGQGAFLRLNDLVQRGDRSGPHAVRRRAVPERLRGIKDRLGNSRPLSAGNVGRVRGRCTPRGREQQDKHGREGVAPCIATHIPSRQRSGSRQGLSGLYTDRAVPFATPRCAQRALACRDQSDVA